MYTFFPKLDPIFGLSWFVHSFQDNRARRKVWSSCEHVLEVAVKVVSIIGRKLRKKLHHRISPNYPCTFNF